MCGIVGLVSPHFDATDRVRASNACMAHRGPDADRVHRELHGESAIVFGHRRLAIIDLSDRLQQPMVLESGDLAITYNGEIYNYRELRSELEAAGLQFFSDSDSEVLLRAWEHWGEQSIAKFVGMFAFAVYERSSSTVTLVRDAFGVKPLYFSLDGGEFGFASEVYALTRLMRSSPPADDAAVHDFITGGRYDFGSRTFLKGIHRMRGGEIAIYSFANQRLDKRRWWTPSVQEEPLNYLEATDKVRDVFIDSVKMHLRSDVPLAFALSGGIDSTAIASVARHLEPDLELHTFSFVDPGAPKNESAWVDAANASFGGIPHEVLVDGSRFGDDVVDMVKAQGEPFGGTSIYAQYSVFRAVREAGFTVSLEGQGADEVFAGYHGFVHARVKSLLDRGDVLGAVGLVIRWSRWHGRNLSSVGKSLIRMLAGHILPDLRLIGRPGSPDLTSVGLTLIKSDQLEFQNVRARHLVSALREQLVAGQLEQLLRHSDRNAMRFSVESRVPFLTTGIADLALSLPESYLLSSAGRTKNVLRSALRGIVPDAIVDRRDKTGFETREWSLIRPLIESKGDLALQGLSLIPTVDIDNARQFFQSASEVDADVDFARRVWRVLCLGIWASQQL
jgi:asparagine synthase (glutamine-hydrolysing)